jgi:D-psicose/D-tagatose/L-ribulose 3-epimerase
MQFGASTFIWVSPFSGSTLDLIDKVGDLGFEIIEICVEDPGTIDPAAIRPRLERRGLKATVCGAFGPDRDISSDDPAVREAGVAYIRRCIDIAADLDAPSVIGPMYSAVGKTRLLGPDAREAQAVLAVDAMVRVADHAARRGIRLAVEPLNRFETDFLNTVDQGLAFLARIGRDNVGLLLDTFHMNIEEKDIPAALRRAGAGLFHFHACSNDRGTPGEDHLDWAGIVRALTDIGYDGPVVIESFTPEIKEIARAVSIWRPLAESQDALARDGLRFLRHAFAGRADAGGPGRYAASARENPA